LPAVAPEEGYAGRLVSHPDSPAELLQAPGTSGLKLEPERPPGARPGVFQKAIFTGSWLASGGGRGYGISDLELKTVLALPCPTRESPLVITPGFAVHYLDGPAGVDLPPRLYDAYTQFRWLHRPVPRLGIDLAVTPGVFSDFRHSSDQMLRITGHGVAAWEWTERLKVLLGVGYFDRLDVNVLPVGGIIWTPNEEVTFELLFPRPRIARRIYWAGAYGQHVQDWLYMAAEFGGATWAIARSSSTDLVNYRDFRILLGVERKVIGGLGARLEVGYVLGRKIQYAGATPEFEPTDTVMLRGGLTY